MRNRSYVVWLIVGGMLAGLSSKAQQTTALPQLKGDTSTPQRHAFSVIDAVEYAKKNNAQIRNALLDIRYQEATNRELTASALPKINGSVSTTYNPNVATQVIPNFISPSVYQVLVDQGVKDGNGQPITMPTEFGYIPAQFGTRWGTSAGVSLNQLLFDGQVFVGLQARQTALDWKTASAEMVDVEVRTNIYKVYFQLVAGHTLIELLDSNISYSSKLLRDTRIMFENGFAEKLDIDRISVQLANFQTERSRALNTLSNGYYGLKVLIGMNPRDELVLTDTISDERIKQGMLENMEYSYEDRKEYKYAQLGKKLNEYNIRRYKLSLLPSVSVGGNYIKNAQRGTFDFFSNGDWFTISNVSANINIPIFNGLYTRSKIQQAQIDLQKTQNSIQALEQSIDNEVISARNNFNTAVTALDFQRSNMSLADTVYQQTKKKYEIGIGSQTDINVAQANLKAAQTNYINALFDAIVARVDYQKATGKL